MRPTSWTDVHDRLLTEAEPELPELSDGELGRIWSRVVPAVQADVEPRRRRRSGVRIGIAAVIGAAVLGGGGIAAADLITARTGEGPSDAENLRLGGPGEKLRLAAPDYGEVIAEETADIPFPTAKARRLALRDQILDARDSNGNEYVATGAVRAWVAGAAVCAWSNQWAAATRDDDDSARTEAIDMIKAAPGWPAVAEIDPEPYSRWETWKARDEDGTITTGRSKDDSLFYYLGPLGEAVEGRDPDAVATVLTDANAWCTSDLLPDLPHADWRPPFADREPSRPAQRRTER